MQLVKTNSSLSVNPVCLSIACSSISSARPKAPWTGFRSSSNAPLFASALVSIIRQSSQDQLTFDAAACIAIRWDGLGNFINSPRTPIYCSKEGQSGTQAFVKSYKNLKFYWILGAGHMVSLFIISYPFFSTTKVYSKTSRLLLHQDAWYKDLKTHPASA